MNLSAKRSRAERLARELAEFESSSPSKIRQKVAATMWEAADADLGEYHSVIELDGFPSVRDCAWHGDEARGRDGVDALRNCPPEAVADFDFRRPPDAALEKFVSPFDAWGREAVMKRPWYQYITARTGLVEQTGLMVFHGTAFIGIAGAIWFRPKTFGPDDTAVLQPLVRPVRAAVTAASCLARQGLPDEDAYVIVRANGAIEQASIEARDWLERQGFEAALGQRVRDFDRNREPDDSPLLEMAEARIVRLATRAGSRYLVCLKLAEQMQRAPADVLTPLQLRIATSAAAGATAGEIGKELERSAETIREHLDSIYHRLRIATRVELARALHERPA